MVEPTVKEVIADHLNIDATSINTDAKVLWDLGADSLDLVEILLALEERFGITLDEHEATEAGDTVSDLITLVAAKVAAKDANSS